MMSKFNHLANLVRENGHRSTWWKRLFATHVVGGLQSPFYSVEPNIIETNWDTLVVLDACRADLFEEVADLDRYDDYETRTSSGGSTKEWTVKNFSDTALTDIVYITANPVVSREVQTAFHRFIEVWRDGFDPALGTVPPEEVTEVAVEIREELSEKRLIVHYLQPHYPFLSRPDLLYTRFDGTEEVETEAENTGAEDIWEAVAEGLVDPETAWKAYRENLQLALDAVEPLLDTCSGRTVITSDHGNMLGERLSGIPIRVYGHPPGVYHSALRTVPWAVIDDSDYRRDDRSGESDADVEQRLRSLGYVS